MVLQCSDDWQKKNVVRAPHKTLIDTNRFYNIIMYTRGDNIYMCVSVDRYLLMIIQADTRLASWCAVIIIIIIYGKLVSGIKSNPYKHTTYIYVYNIM